MPEKGIWQRHFHEASALQRHRSKQDLEQRLSAPTTVMHGSQASPFDTSSFAGYSFSWSAKGMRRSLQFGNSDPSMLRFYQE